MESQTAYKLLFADYPDVVNVEQMREISAVFATKPLTGFYGLGKLEVSLSAAAIESRSSTFWNTWN